MKLIKTIALIAASLTFLALPSFVSADDNGYVGYVACGWRTKAPQATTCSKDGRIGAFFKSNNATVKFRTCVTFPNGERACTHRSTEHQGLYYVNHLGVGTKGTLKVRWKVGGVVVATYSIQVT